MTDNTSPKTMKWKRAIFCCYLLTLGCLGVEVKDRRASSNCETYLTPGEVQSGLSAFKDLKCLYAISKDCFGPNLTCRKCKTKLATSDVAVMECPEDDRCAAKITLKNRIMAILIVEAPNCQGEDCLEDGSPCRYCRERKTFYNSKLQSCASLTEESDTREPAPTVAPMDPRNAHCAAQLSSFDKSEGVSAFYDTSCGGIDLGRRNGGCFDNGLLCRMCKVKDSSISSHLQQCPAGGSNEEQLPASPPVVRQIASPETVVTRLNPTPAKPVEDDPLVSPLPSEAATEACRSWIPDKGRAAGMSAFFDPTCTEMSSGCLNNGVMCRVCKREASTLATNLPLCPSQPVSSNSMIAGGSVEHLNDHTAEQGSRVVPDEIPSTPEKVAAVVPKPPGATPTQGIAFPANDTIREKGTNHCIDMVPAASVEKGISAVYAPSCAEKDDEHCFAGGILCKYCKLNETHANANLPNCDRQPDCQELAMYLDQPGVSAVKEPLCADQEPGIPALVTDCLGDGTPCRLCRTTPNSDNSHLFTCNNLETLASAAPHNQNTIHAGPVHPEEDATDSKSSAGTVGLTMMGLALVVGIVIVLRDHRQAGENSESTSPRTSTLGLIYRELAQAESTPVQWKEEGSESQDLKSSKDCLAHV